MSLTKVEEKVKRFNETVKGLEGVFIGWVGQEEARLQRELTTAEMDEKIAEVDSKIKELMSNGHSVSTKYNVETEEAKVEAVMDEEVRKIFGNKVDRFYEAVSTHDDEAMAWIDQEEERLQRELTDEEIGVIADKIREKYNIRYEN